MDNRVIHVPVAVLLHSDLPDSAKLVWMARRLSPTAGSAELEAATGLSRHTVLSGISQVDALKLPPGGARVPVPGALLADRRVGSPVKILYGLLQATPDCRGQSGQFTYASLCSRTKFCRNTLKRAIAELTGAGWAQATQANRLKPIHFRLGSPEQRRSQVEAAMAGRRLKRAKYRGEALMQEYLSLLIDSNEYTDNYRPGFLTSPMTGERLELDRCYSDNVAFEFHGAQHDRATDQFSQDTVDAQHLRDLIKAGLCLYQGIHLVIIRAEDLSLHGMTRKIGRSMPLRDLAGHEPLIDLLDEASLTYRAAAEAAKN